MNARKQSETWNSGMKKHLEAMNKLTGRKAAFEAFRESTGTQAAHDEALRKEYTKPRWARQRLNLCKGKRLAFANFFNQMSALTEDQSQRLVVAYGAGRTVPKKS